jgi:hypothetical protein
MASLSRAWYTWKALIHDQGSFAIFKTYGARIIEYYTILSLKMKKIN